MRRFRFLCGLLCLLLLCACGVREGEAASLTVHPKTKQLTLGLEVSAATHLSVEIRPSDAHVNLVWSSSKPELASVDERGFVTAYKPGTVSITVKDTVTGKKSTCTIKILTLPQEILLQATEATLRAGRRLDLSPKLRPAQYIPKIHRSITWSSSQPEVASVDAGGNVLAHAPGIAVITAETINGLTAVCTITVTE